MEINCILGAGEVANALKGNLNGEVKLYDVGEWEGQELIDCTFLHIAIPYSDRFISICEEAEKIFSPDILIIHSTVKPGTAKKLDCLYSPVTGRHDDDFSQNITLYKKFIAGNKSEYEQIKDQFKVSTEYWGENTSELEYAKIMSTTRMYWDLLFQKLLEKDCEKNGYDLMQVYYRWTDNYNAGIRVKHPRWERPIYTRMETDIPGGHCVHQNIPLVDNQITAFIKAYEKELIYHVTEEGTVNGN